MSTDVRTPNDGLCLACLCAAWCRLCDDYRPTFEQVAAEFEAQAPGLRPHWIDIEDDAELVGNVDIETFPTLLLADAGGVRFFGPLTPQPDTLRRLLRALVLQPPAADVDADVQALAQRLRQRR